MMSSTSNAIVSLLSITGFAGPPSFVGTELQFLKLNRHGSDGTASTE
jgi:hypothetical protein